MSYHVTAELMPQINYPNAQYYAVSNTHGVRVGIVVITHAPNMSPTVSCHNAEMTYTRPVSLAWLEAVRDTGNNLITE